MRYTDQFGSLGGIGTTDSFATQRALSEHYPAEDNSRDAEIAAVRHITKAIKSLPVWAKSGPAYAQILAVIVSEIEASGWAHLDRAEEATNLIADAHDKLENVNV